MTDEIKFKHIISSDKKLEYWGYGEWVEEADWAEFEHAGLKCTIIRMAAADGPKGGVYGGYLTGYIHIPKDNVLYMKDLFDFKHDLEVHGGISFSDFREGNWLIGFDAAHSCDLTPSMQAIMKKIDDETNNFMKSLGHDISNSLIFHREYRNMQYVIDQCKDLAEQVSKTKAEDLVARE